LASPTYCCWSASVFSLYSYRAPPDLHSFPTRRSSDLDWDGSRGGRSSARLERQVVALEVGGSSPLGHPTAAAPAPRGAAVSSVEQEEHTSELQSREISYAVFCLKKKKKTHT